MKKGVTMMCLPPLAPIKIIHTCCLVTFRAILRVFGFDDFVEKRLQSYNREEGRKNKMR